MNSVHLRKWLHGISGLLQHGNSTLSTKFTTLLVKPCRHVCQKLSWQGSCSSRKFLLERSMLCEKLFSKVLNCHTTRKMHTFTWSKTVPSYCLPHKLPSLPFSKLFVCTLNWWTCLRSKRKEIFDAPSCELSSRSDSGCFGVGAVFEANAVFIIFVEVCLASVLLATEELPSSCRKTWVFHPSERFLLLVLLTSRARLLGARSHFPQTDASFHCWHHPCFLPLRSDCQSCAVNGTTLDFWPNQS